MPRGNSRTVCVAVLWVVAMLGIACNGGSSPSLSDGAAGAGASGDAGASAALQAKCDQLIKATCQRSAECEKNDGGSSPSASSCVTTVMKDFDCSRTRAVSATYPQCLKDLAALSCASLYPGGDFQPPGACKGVIDLAPTKERQQCDLLESTVCDRFVECSKSTDPAGDKAGCLQVIGDAIPCELAVGVSATYDQCMQNLKGWTCDMIYPGQQLKLPKECVQVIMTNRALTVTASALMSRNGDKGVPSSRVRRAVPGLFEGELRLITRP